MDVFFTKFKYNERRCGFKLGKFTHKSIHIRSWLKTQICNNKKRRKYTSVKTSTALIADSEVPNFTINLIIFYGKIQFFFQPRVCFDVSYVVAGSGAMLCALRYKPLRLSSFSSHG